MILILLITIFFDIIKAQDIFGIQKLIFEENFENPEINESKWNFELGNGINGFYLNESHYNRNNKENIFIQDNQLHIKVKLENYGNKNYTSARITTKNSFHFTHGYVEAKIKILSLAVGGDITKNRKIDNSAFPLEMIIDYIRIYQEKDDFKYLKNLILLDFCFL